MPLGEKTNNKNLFFLRDSKKTKNSPLFTFKKGEGQSFTVGISVNTKRQVHPSRREGRTATLKQHATCRSCRHSSWTWECISNVNQWITCCSGTGCRKVLDVPAASQAWKERNDQKSHLQLQLPPAKSACCSPLSLSCPGRRCAEAKPSTVRNRGCFWTGMSVSVLAYRTVSGLNTQEHE